MVDVLIRPSLQDRVDAEDAVRAARATLDHQAADPQASLCVVITDDAEIRALNRQYRGIDAPTDVLSFAMQDDVAARSLDVGTGLPPAQADVPFVVAPEQDEGATAYLGDVIIAFPRVVAQAAEEGHSPAHELRLLIVHGVLHLLGHDHATAQDEARMWAMQDEILEALRREEDA